MRISALDHVSQKAISAQLPKFATYQCVIVETLATSAGFPDMQPKTPPGPETNEIRIVKYQKLTVKPTDQG